MYIFFWFKNKLKGHSNLTAYINIPFEIEAYQKQSDPAYILNRKLYSWRNFLLKK